MHNFQDPWPISIDMLNNAAELDFPVNHWKVGYKAKMVAEFYRNRNFSYFNDTPFEWAQMQGLYLVVDDNVDDYEFQLIGATDFLLGRVNLSTKDKPYLATQSDVHKQFPPRDLDIWPSEFSEKADTSNDWKTGWDTPETEKEETMTDKPKLLILGYGRHGKDTVAQLLADDYGFKFVSSSVFVGKEVMWDSWGIAKYNSFSAMFDDRVNHRELWMEMISAYNTPDKTKTATTMLERGFDLYVGMRRLDELRACQAADIFDFIIWVDASDRHPPETGSMDITKENSRCDFVVDNNGPETALPAELKKVMDRIEDANLRNIFKDDMPDHPWDHMSPVEILADWVGADVDELAEIEDEQDFPIPVRAAPDYETMAIALDSLELVMYYDHEGSKLVMKNVAPTPIVFHFVSTPQPASDWVKSMFLPSVDSWLNLELKPSIAEELEGALARGYCHDENSHKEMDVDLCQAQLEELVPVFKSTRAKIGDLEETTTTVEGATTIINIENVYITDKD